MTKVINSPHNGPMCTMEDLVAQFIDLSPKIYNEFIPDPNSSSEASQITGFYMTPEEMSYCPTYYEITHSKLSGLSVTLYKKAEYKGDENNSSIINFSGGKTFKFNGRDGHFPELDVVPVSNTIYKNNSLVRLCDVVSVYVPKKVSLHIDNFLIKKIVIDNNGKEIYTDEYFEKYNPFITNNVELKPYNIFTYSNSMKVEYEITDKSYMYFQIDEIHAQEYIPDYETYKNFAIRVVINKTTTIKEDFFMGRVYKIYDVVGDVDIYLSANKKYLHTMVVNMRGDGGSFINLGHLGLLGTVDVNIIEFMKSTGTYSLAYTDYPTNDDIHLNMNLFIVPGDQERYPVKDYSFQMLGVSSSETESMIQTKIYPPTGEFTDPVEFDEMGAVIHIPDNVDVSKYSTLILNINVSAKFLDRTIYINSDQKDPEAYKDMTLFGKPVSLSDYKEGSKVRYEYTYTEEDDILYQQTGKIPWSFRINYNAEAFADIRSIISGVKLYEIFALIGDVDETRADSNGVVSGEFKVANIRNGKVLNIQICTSLINILLTRSMSTYNKIAVMNKFTNSLVFGTFDTQAEDTTNMIQTDRISYDVYVQAGKSDPESTALSYSFYKKSSSKNWDLVESNTYLLSDEEHITLGFGKKSYFEMIMIGMNGMSTEADVLCYILKDLNFNNLENVGNPSYKVTFDVGDTFIAKTVKIKIPKLGLAYKTITISDFYTLGDNIEFEDVSDSDYYIYSCDLSTDNKVKEFYADLDMFSATPGYFSSVKVTTEQTINETGSVESSTSVDLYNDGGALKREYTFTYRNDATLVVFTFEAVRSNTRFPIIVANNDSDIKILNGDTDEVICDGILTYNAENPKIVMTSSKTSGYFNFKITSKSGTINTVRYSKNLTGANIETLTLVNNVGNVYIRQHLSQTPQYFIVQGTTSSKVLYVALKNAKTNGVVVKKGSGSMFSDWIKESLVGLGDIKRSSDNTTIYATIDELPAPPKFLGMKMTNSSGIEVVCNLTLYYSDNYKSFDDSGWSTADTTSGSLYDYQYECNLAHEPLEATSYKIVIDVADVVFDGMYLNSTSSSLGEKVEHIPTIKGTSFYGVIRATGSGITSSDIKVGEMYVSYISSPVYKWSISKDGFTYLVYEMKINSFDQPSYTTVEICKMLYKNTTPLVFKGTFGRTISAGFSEIANKMMCQSHMGGIDNVLYMSRVHTLVGVYDRCMYVYMYGIYEKTSTGTQYYLYDANESIFRIMHGGNDVTHLFSIEMRHILPVRPTSSGYIKVVLRIQFKGSLELPEVGEYTIISNYGYGTLSTVNFIVASTPLIHWCMIDLDLLTNQTYIALEDSAKSLIGHTGLPVGYTRKSVNGIAPYFVNKNKGTTGHYICDDIMESCYTAINKDMLSFGVPFSDSPVPADKKNILLYWQNSQVTSGMCSTLANKGLVVTGSSGNNWNKRLVSTFSESLSNNHQYHIYHGNTKITHSDTYLFHTGEGHAGNIEFDILYEYYYTGDNITKVVVTLENLFISKLYSNGFSMIYKLILKSGNSTKFNFSSLTGYFPPFEYMNGSLPNYTFTFDMEATLSNSGDRLRICSLKDIDLTILKDSIEYSIDAPLTLDSRCEFDKDYSVPLLVTYTIPEALTKSSETTGYIVPYSLQIRINRTEIKHRN